MSIDPSILTVGHDSGPVEIAVRVRSGWAPGLFWLGGFRSNMDGLKASAIDDWASERGLACTRFDYSGHGLSSSEFATGTISRWLNEAEAVFDTFTDKPQILVGSSMGGWMAVLLAQRLADKGQLDRLAGLVLIAPAINMTSELMWDRFDETIRSTILETGRFERPSDYSPDPDVITRALIEDGAHHSLGPKPLRIGAPVRIIQGREDDVVPWTHAVALAERLPADETSLSLIQDGDHRLSRPEDLNHMLAAIGDLVERFDDR